MTYEEAAHIISNNYHDNHFTSQEHSALSHTHNAIKMFKINETTKLTGSLAYQANQAQKIMDTQYPDELYDELIILMRERMLWEIL